MGAETYVAIAEQYGFNEEQTAYFLVHCAEACMRTVRSAPMGYSMVRELCSDSLECRLVSVFIFEDLGKSLEVTRSLNQAGRSVQAAHALRLSADLHEISARRFEVEGETVDAGYALLNAAGALLRKRNRMDYIDRIGMLIGRGRVLLEDSGEAFKRTYLDHLIGSYEALRSSDGSPCGPPQNI
jgi:hypothetical protein